MILNDLGFQTEKRLVEKREVIPREARVIYEFLIFYKIYKVFTYYYYYIFTYNLLTYKNQQ